MLFDGIPTECLESCCSECSISCCCVVIICSVGLCVCVIVDPGIGYLLISFIFISWAPLLAVCNNSTHTQTHTRTHTHPFNVPFSGTTRVSRYKKGKTNLDLAEARDSEWPWHKLSHMQVCTSLQTDNHTSTPPLSFLQTGCPSCHPTNSVKALKATTQHNVFQILSQSLIYWAVR